jgi:hypothetical protein
MKTEKNKERMEKEEITKGRERNQTRKKDKKKEFLDSQLP